MIKELIIKYKVIYCVVLCSMTLLSACEAREVKCGEISNYSFAPETNRVTIRSGELKIVEFQFFPQPPRKMAFHRNLLDQIYLSSWEQIESRGPFTPAGRTSEVIIDTLGADNPLVFQVNISRKEVDGEQVLLQFDGLGVIEAATGEEISISPVFVPALVCPSDSADGLSSEELVIFVE